MPSFVALGDSFTEGLDDPRKDGSYRGWADLVAAAVSATTQDLRYANLAVRGRLFAEVVAEQVPPALDMGADLVSFAAGGNDALRPRFDIDRIGERLDRVVRRFTAAGAVVVLYTTPDVTSQLPARRFMLRRAHAYNAMIRPIAARHGAVLVDLWADRGFVHRRLWSDDRLHLSAMGHRRVAARVLVALGLPVDSAWTRSPAPGNPLPWRAARHADVRWARSHFAPWLRRRLTGRSTGDHTGPKRPQLTPMLVHEH